jgi:hypothetical protein
MAYIQNDNDNIDNNVNIDMTWDDPATPVAQPIAPVIAPNGWHWYPDANGNLCSHYVDQDGNDSTVWMQNNDGSFYWRCANVGYTCRDIGIDGRRGIFFQDVLVGTMIMDNQLTVTWLPETYILPEHIPVQNINNIYIQYDIHDNDNINYNFTEVNDIDDVDDTNDE